TVIGTPEASLPRTNRTGDSGFPFRTLSRSLATWTLSGASIGRALARRGACAGLRGHQQAQVVLGCWVIVIVGCLCPVFRGGHIDTSLTPGSTPNTSGTGYVRHVDDARAAGFSAGAFNSVSEVVEAVREVDREQDAAHLVCAG